MAGRVGVSSMNPAFKLASNYYKQSPQSLSHRQAVTRLYRHSLKLMMSWAIDRDLINEEAEKIRSRFDLFQTYDPSSGAVKRALREGQEEVAKYNSTQINMFCLIFLVVQSL